MKNELTIREYTKQIEMEVSKLHSCPSICIEEQVLKNDIECKKTIVKELDDFFALLDVGISVVTEIHKVCKENALGDGNKFVYTSLTAKMVSQLLSIRKLLYSGHMDGVKCLIRPFQEALEIFFSCLINKEFAYKYGAVDKLYDNNKFWYENISKNKLDIYMHQIFDTLKFPSAISKNYFSRRKSSVKFLSESIHSSFNSAFATFIMPTINGEINENLCGKITTAYPKGIYETLTDISLLNTIFFRCLDEGHAFAFDKIDFGEEKYFTYHYFFRMFQTTCSLYDEDLQKRGIDIMNALKAASEIIAKEQEDIAKEEASIAKDNQM